MKSVYLSSAATVLSEWLSESKWLPGFEVFQKCVRNTRPSHSRDEWVRLPTPAKESGSSWRRGQKNRKKPIGSQSICSGGLYRLAQLLWLASVLRFSIISAQHCMLLLEYHSFTEDSWVETQIKTRGSPGFIHLVCTICLNR